ncbi:hypothetical protein PV10_03531 [Exophiala mesophila]|uniref:L-dopachrome isomerase n=1 Tax=Exophiala mesophila TaxID=212818 RepID=A0A0D1X2E9_EXOME|nr:uncharacterized protein PV10_03531 [Exophiala mesophila]KIV95940.1 hypothetical protein PV10_03531 [Exophiala mesophila]
MSSAPSSTSRIHATPVENAFPTPPTGETNPNATYRLKGRLSPAPQRLLNVQRAQSTPPEITHAYQFGTLTKTTDSQLSDVATLENSWQRLNTSKKRSQYYSDAFAYREINNTARERVTKDFVIVAEIKTNCYVELEKDFMIDLSFRLSEIYQRPASCIMVILNTEVTMLLAGTLEPAYSLNLTALSSEIAATKNKRSAFLLQEFMLDNLDIPPKRGVVRFETMAEENFATNGLTALQEIEDLERQSMDDDSRFRAMSRQSRRAKKSSSGVPMLAERVRAGLPSLRTGTPSHQHYATIATDSNPKSTVTSAPLHKKVKSRKSILAFFKR